MMTNKDAWHCLNKLKEDSYEVYMLGSVLDEAMDVALNLLSIDKNESGNTIETLFDEYKKVTEGQLRELMRKNQEKSFRIDELEFMITGLNTQLENYRKKLSLLMVETPKEGI